MPEARTLLYLLAFRVWNALALKTYFNPDEYWQSLEVAHEFVFGYGYLTWEWARQIRGFAYPAVFAALFKSLQVLKWDHPEIIVLAPKILQATSAALGDYFTYRLAARLFGRRSAKWAVRDADFHFLKRL